jgi:hypothetical protein
MVNPSTVGEFYVLSGNVAVIVARVRYGKIDAAADHFKQFDWASSMQWRCPLAEPLDVKSSLDTQQKFWREVRITFLRGHVANTWTKIDSAAVEDACDALVSVEEQVRFIEEQIRIDSIGVAVGTGRPFDA